MKHYQLSHSYQNRYHAVSHLVTWSGSFWVPVDILLNTIFSAFRPHGHTHPVRSCSVPCDVLFFGKVLCKAQCAYASGHYGCHFTSGLAYSRYQPQNGVACFVVKWFLSPWVAMSCFLQTSLSPCRGAKLKSSIDTALFRRAAIGLNITNIGNFSMAPANPGVISAKCKKK